MPEQKAAAPKQSEPKSAAKPDLVPAGESSDPNVQTLLAELESARLNDNEADVRQIIARIAELGYRAE
jgi:hypothetical protein